MKNKIKLVVTLCMLLVVMTACGAAGSKKVGLTCEELQAKLVEMNVADSGTVTNIVNEEGHKAFGCVTNKFWVVAFVDYGDDKAGCDDEMKEWITDLKLVADRPEKNQTIYEMDDQNAYLLFSRVGNTILMLSGMKKDKAEIRNVAQTLGYY